MPMDDEHKRNIAEGQRQRYKLMREAWSKVQAGKENTSDTSYTVKGVVAWLWAHYRGDWKELSRDLGKWKPADPL